MLTAISPLDGRYTQTTSVLQKYFSEFALIKYRVYVEVKYFQKLAKTIPQLNGISDDVLTTLDDIYTTFSLEDATKIKETEKVTNHDVKAVEYFVKEKLSSAGLGQFLEFVHFGLTSQDINNTATPLLIKNAMEEVILPKLLELVTSIREKASMYKDIPMLARTHGQAASPTTMGKEYYVFVERLEDEINLLNQIQLKAKFGGATGNYNAHLAAFPQIDWRTFGDEFVESLGLKRAKTTTQIAHYDDHGALFHSWSRINTILVDYARDIWAYVSMDYFKQKTKAGEIGSSAMPHKVNPIDFENAEGNLGLANALFEYLSAKLPISRLQRDLTDSTVLRNVGVPFGHSLIAYTSLIKGNTKLELNTLKLHQDLDNNWAVVAEAIQNILRREMYPEPYEALKNLTRGNAHITKDVIYQFVDGLSINDDIKNEIKAITPHNYVGYTF
jgi:adenylosuccinate lyase